MREFSAGDEPFYTIYSRKYSWLVYILCDTRDFKSLASAYSTTAAYSLQNRRVAVNVKRIDRIVNAFWRHHPDLNRGLGLCRPLPYRLAMVPYSIHMLMVGTIGLEPMTLCL